MWIKAGITGGGVLIWFLGHFAEKGAEETNAEEE